MLRCRILILAKTVLKKCIYALSSQSTTFLFWVLLQERVFILFVTWTLVNYDNNVIFNTFIKFQFIFSCFRNLAGNSQC